MTWVQTLFLTDVATSNPYPTTSKLLSDEQPTGEVSLRGGGFNHSSPGLSDAGQWQPGISVDEDESAWEIDKPGDSAPGTTRRGWLWDEKLTGYKLAATPHYAWLKLGAVSGYQRNARIAWRISIVRGSGNIWVEQRTILSTVLPGSDGYSGGQAGWQSNTARIYPATLPSTSVHGGDMSSGGGTEHVFTDDDRILIELGFCDAETGDGADACWDVFYSNSSTYVQLTMDYSGVAAAGIATLTAAGVSAGTVEGDTGKHFHMRAYRYNNAPPDYETWIAHGVPNANNPSTDPITDLTVTSWWEDET